jgi:WD40 repeat protein
MLVNDVGCQSLSITNKQVFSCGMDATLRLSNFTESKTTELHTEKSPWNVAANDKLLTAINLDTTISLFSPEGKHMDTIANESTGTGMCICLSPDATRAAVGTSLGLVQVWDLEVCRVLDSVKHAKAVRDICWKEDLMSVACDDGYMTVYDVSRVEFGQHDAIASFSHISRTNRIPWVTTVSQSSLLFATGTSDAKIRVWDLGTRQTMATFGVGGVSPVILDASDEAVKQGGHVGCVWKVRYSLDGRRLASVAEDGLLIVYETS